MNDSFDGRLRQDRFNFMYLQWETWGIQGQAAIKNSRAGSLSFELHKKKKKKNKFLAKLMILWRPALAAYISWNMHVSTYESIDIVKKENTEICPFSINLIRVPLAIICFPPPSIDSTSLLRIDRLYLGNRDSAVW